MFGFFLSWTRPSPEQQKSCIERSKSCFNYAPKYNCATRPSEDEDWKKKKQLRDAGFHNNESRVLLGSGDRTFRLAKSALQSWKHFGLDWAYVEPNTSVKKGTNFCVCARILRGLPWVAMPLQIAFVNDITFGSNNEKGRFDFGSGTLRGHFLAGEERFTIQWDKDDQVWYEISSFSKPAHFLSAFGYPIVKSMQTNFAMGSIHALLKHMPDHERRE